MNHKPPHINARNRKDREETKLTDKQIENWRKVLFGIIGPYALIMPASEIQDYRDKFNLDAKEYERRMN